MTEELLHTAVRALAGMCDGARTYDDRGYNKIDSAWGKSLASKSFDRWTHKEKFSAHRMLRKYKKQLMGYGIDYDQIPQPMAPQPTACRVMLSNDTIEVRFGYSANLVQQVKLIEGRRYNPDGKFWYLPATPQHAVKAVEFARNFDFDIQEAVHQLADKIDPTIDEPVLPPKNITLTEDSAEIKFPYDPELIEAVKLISGARWNKPKGVWRVPLTADALPDLIEFADERGFVAPIDHLRLLADKLKGMMSESIEASKAADAELTVLGLGGELRPFQKAGVKYAAEKKRLIIGDQMGLGKTVEALATMQYLDAFPALVICPASLKFNWVKEARHWLPGRTLQMLGGDSFGRADADITIINYDRLRDYREYLCCREYQAIVGDESQYLKNPTAQRTIIFEEICNGTIYGRNGKKAARREKEVVGKQIPIRLLLSGTPLMNRPNELISQLQILDRLAEFGGWKSFNRRYCGMFFTRYGIDNSGATNLVELNDLLRARCYLRRTKEEVLKELPPKIRTIVPMEISNRREYERAERDLINWLKVTKGQAKADAAARAEQLVRISALKQLAAKGKMESIKEWVHDFLDTDEKIVLFGWHKEIVGDLAKEFTCRQITGDTPLVVRDQAVREFQEEARAKVLSCNILAGGVGLTLTAASDVGFCELGWNPAQMDQAADRCHRIGQTDTVNEWWFVAKKTIEVDIQSLIEEKRSVVNAATDGIEGQQDVSIMNELIDRLTSGEERRDEDNDWLELPF